MKSSLAVSLTILQKQFRLFAQKELQKHNITQGQLFFILYIGKYPQCSPKELSTQLQLDTGHTTRSLSKLEQNQFITQEMNPNDKRARFLTLTKKGQDIFELSHELFYQWDRTILQCLSTSEQETLLILLNKLIFNTER